MFLPSAQCGRFSRSELNSRLLESINHVLEQSAGVLESDPVNVERLTGELEAGAVSNPFLFAGFFEMIAAIEADQYDLAQQNMDAMFACPARYETTFRVARYGNQHFSTDELEIIRRRFARANGDDLIRPSIGEVGESFAAQAQRCLNMLGEMAPDSYAEIDEVVTAFLTASGNADKDGIQFDGVSNLEMWGLICINESFSKSDLRLCEALAHETAHCTLFGLSPREFFVDNSDEERYKSPLRLDPRPLDGIYHATFVLARMHYAISEMRDSGKLDKADTTEAADLLRAGEKHFTDGLAVLEKYAIYTPTGRTIMDDAIDYMRSF